MITNAYTKKTAALMGSLIGLAGIVNHGIFEIAQGFKSTNGYFIEAIGPDHRFWVHGTEGAFTLIPNFLITGIVVVIIGLTTIIWSQKFLHRKNGPKVLLLLFTLLTLTGGGIGHIVVWLPIWLLSTRIHSPLKWWRKKLNQNVRPLLSSLWIPSSIIAALSWLIVMEIGIFGYLPGINDPDTILSMVFVFIFITIIFTTSTFITAFAKDLNTKSLDESR